MSGPTEANKFQMGEFRDEIGNFLGRVGESLRGRKLMHELMRRNEAGRLRDVTFENCTLCGSRILCVV
jgi:hypothetical protein